MQLQNRLLKWSLGGARFSFIHLACWAARDMGCIGAAMAMFLLAPVPMLRTAKADTIVPFCETIDSLPEGIREFASMLCAVREGVFADGRDPTLAFKFVEAVETPGTHEGTDFYGQTVSFEAVQVITLPLHASHPDTFTTADAGSFCIGWLEGPAGRIAVSAICLRKESLTGDPIISAFLVTELITDADVLASAQSERISAGLIPEIADSSEIDGATGGQSIPEDERGSTLTTKATDELVLVTSTFHSDLIGVVIPPTGGPLPIQTYNYTDCARSARLHFNINDSKNRSNLTNCAVGALDTLQMGLILCGLAGGFGALFGPLGAIGAFGFCMLTVEAAAADQAAGCHSTFKNAQNANAAHFAQDLADCALRFPQTQPVP